MVEKNTNTDDILIIQNNKSIKNNFNIDNKNK